MRFLELYFNPKGKEHTRYESFCYKPSSAAEKKLGYLSIAGELTNILPPNENLLRKIAETAKNLYYSGHNQMAQQATEKMLDGINAFLETLRKNGNVSWLGNIHLALLAVCGKELFFTKTGSVKILLARNGELIDVGKHLETPQILHPTRNFSHLVSGEVFAKDVILCITKDVFHFLETTGIIYQFASAETGEMEKLLKKSLERHEKELKEYPGLLLVLRIDKIEKPVSVKRHFPVSLPNLPRRLGTSFRNLKNRIKMPRPTHLPPIKEGAKRINPLATSRSPFVGETKKKFFLLATFLIILLSGFGLAQFQKKITNTEAEQKFLVIQQKLWDAENKLIANQNKEANLLFQEAMNDLEELKDSPLKSRIEKIRQETEERLMQINKISNVEAKRIFVGQIEPSFLIRLEDIFYFINPELKEMELWNATKNEKQLIPLPWSFHLAKEFQGFILFYERGTNKIIVRDGEEIKLLPPYPEFSPKDGSVFQNAVYFVDAKKGEIVKYEIIADQKELIPQNWTSVREDKKLRNALSLSLDGSLWILDKNGLVLRYWGGNWKETLDVPLWPPLKHPTKIFTSRSLPHLYILDPPEKRIIVLDKKGNIIQQYRSDQFTNLKDFIVSDNGKTIYLMNGKELYKLAAEE